MNKTRCLLTLGAALMLAPFSLAKGIATDTAGNVLVTGPITDASGNNVTAIPRL